MSQWVYTVLRCRISFVVSPMLHGTSWSYTMRKDILDFTVSYLLHWTMIGYKDWNMNICCYIFFSWECLCYYITLLELVVLWIINDFHIMRSHLFGRFNGFCRRKHRGRHYVKKMFLPRCMLECGIGIPSLKKP